MIAVAVSVPSALCPRARTVSPSARSSTDATDDVAIEVESERVTVTVSPSVVVTTMVSPSIEAMTPEVRTWAPESPGGAGAEDDESVLPLSVTR